MREVYLYQTVHVLDGECLCLREHLAVLDRWSRTLFGCPGPQDAREVGTAVAAVVVYLVLSHAAMVFGMFDPVQFGWRASDDMHMTHGAHAMPETLAGHVIH